MRATLVLLSAASAAALVPTARLASAGHAARCATPEMCGVLAVVNSKLSLEALRLKTLTLQRLVRHRGPDGSGIHVVETPDGLRCSSVAHERLAIVDPLSGNQPLFSHDSVRSLTVNGEIYNHKELRAELKDTTPFRTESDCEVRRASPRSPPSAAERRSRDPPLRYTPPHVSPHAPPSHTHTPPHPAASYPPPPPPRSSCTPSTSTASTWRPSSTATSPSSS